MKHKRLIFILALLVTLTSKIIITTNDMKYNQSQEKLQVYIVEPGDTLWQVAKELKLKQDVRQTVYEIRKLNDITPQIYPGQEILVPAQN